MPYLSPDPPPDVVVTTRNALRAIIADEVDRAVRRAMVSMFEDLGRDDEWLTPKQAAKVYGRHRSTLHRWAKLGLLPTRKIGGSRYYDARAIERIAGQADV